MGTTWGLELPKVAVSRRVSRVDNIGGSERKTWATLDGAGCIRHIWVTVPAAQDVNRQVVVRIYFDDEPEPYVEAPLGDFFGVMHGKPWYPINTEFLSVKANSGYNCMFAMPFARSARIEFEAGEQGMCIFLQVDWHAYPDQELTEPRRFCARWRREMPTEAYGEEYLMLDADGPGQLVGFVYGVRLLDDTDRWSHGGADNIYIDGDGAHPAFLRGIGGEDTFGTSYGGAIHTPETHLYAALPYYEHEDVGTARPAQRVVGYRFFTHDAIAFQSSVHMRFGCMANDICSMVYWYAERPVRPFFALPDWPKLLPGVDLPRGTCDLALPHDGEWRLGAPFRKEGDDAVRACLLANADGETEAADARWATRAAHHGFVDFHHMGRPHERGVGRTHTGVVGVARCVLDAPCDTTARVRVAWDDHLALQVNGTAPIDLGDNACFGAQAIDVRLAKGENSVTLALSNELGLNHGGWAFAFHATAPDGMALVPRTAR